MKFGINQEVKIKLLDLKRLNNGTYEKVAYTINFLKDNPLKGKLIKENRYIMDVVATNLKIMYIFKDDKLAIVDLEE